MATVYSENDKRPETLAEASFARSLRETRAYTVGVRARRKVLERSLRRLSVGSSLPGDRTDNTPALRRDTKVRNRLELSAYPYLLQPRGRLVQLASDGSVDLTKTLAVLTHYRYILASRKGTNAT